MTTHSLISLDSTDLWRETLNDFDHGFAYTWEHCYAMRLTTGFDTHLYCFESGESRIAGPFCARRFNGHIDIVKPFGFCGFVGTRSHPEFAASLQEFARDSEYVCGYLGVDPLQSRDFGFDVSALPVHGTAHVLDISVGEPELFRRLSTLRRRQLRHWDRIASAITEDQAELQNLFLDRYPDFMREKAARSFYHLTRETLAFLLAQDNVFLIGAHDEEGIAAVSVFGHTRTVGEYLFNIPLSTTGRRYAAALIWQGIMRLRSLGTPRLSLSGSYADDGLYDFKRRFGGERLPVRHLKQVFDQQTFEHLSARGSRQHGRRVLSPLPEGWRPGWCVETLPAPSAPTSWHLGVVATLTPGSLVMPVC